MILLSKWNNNWEVVLYLENLEEESKVKENPLDQVLAGGMRAVIDLTLEKVEDEPNPPPAWSC